MAASNLIIGCGWSLSGKTTVMNLVSEKLRIPYLDIDAIRKAAFGEPPKDLTGETQNEAAEMLAAYRLLSRVCDEHLHLGRSLIVTATFSKNTYHEIWNAMLDRHPQAQAHLIWVKPVPGADTEEAVSRLLAERSTNYRGATTSYHRYTEVRDRFLENGRALIEKREHLKALTWPEFSREETAEQILRYLDRKIS